MSDIRLKGFPERTKVDDALKIFFSKVRLDQPEAKDLGIDEGLGEILAEDVYAKCDVPSFNRSAMDGYAVRSTDTVGSSANNPVILRVVGVSETGYFPTAVAGRSNAVRISTGAPLPDGADAVIMLEYTRDLGRDRIEVYRPVTPYENVSRVGEDVKKGEKVLGKGTVLQPQDIGILAAVGRRTVKVLRRVEIAVLSTGDELVELGGDVEPGRITDVNRHALLASVREVGCRPYDLGIARDDVDEIGLKIVNGLKNADVVLVTGGISVGSKDLVSEAVNSLGKPGMIVRGISMRPGMPTSLAAIGDKPVILLPGSPVAAIISFNVFVKPILAAMLGVHLGLVKGQVVKAKMARKVASATGSRTFLRVIVGKVGDEYIAEPVRTSGSSIISSMVKANGIVVIPESKEGLEEGEEVDVELLRTLGR